MQYTIRHVTRFRYSASITESIMEVRAQPRSEGNQHCLDFHLRTSPRASIMAHRDQFGNWVHHFDIPNSHTQLAIIAESLVDMGPVTPLPQALDARAWTVLDELTARDDYWDTLTPSRFAAPSLLLDELADELTVRRRDDPLTVLRELNSAIYRAFGYAPRTTRVDSPIDEALRLRKGVCQDFTHIMITLVRRLGIPCRYVSGYLFQQGRGLERVTSTAMHAWLEAYLPDLGWVGFDPTNDTPVDERHVRVALGRDYADVSPTRGVFRGHADSELSVTVRLSTPRSSSTDDAALSPTWFAIPAEEDDSILPVLAMQQQQQ